MGEGMDVAILAAARFAIREPFAGGMEMHTHVLAEHLTRRGHRVTVYAADADGPYEVRRMEPVAFEASPTARRDVSAGPAGTLAEHHSYLEAILELHRREHQLVHINAVHHLPFVCAGLLAPSVVTATLHTPPTPWLESALHLAATRDAVPAMVSVSRANADAWSSVDVQRVIPNGVDLERWRPGPGGDGAVWWGRLVPEKAPHLAIDAARQAGVALSLLGPIHDQAYFDREVAPRLGRDVQYLGHHAVADVAEVVGRSAVAVATPVWDEPFGLVVAEALACGTPVAGFARGALPEVVDAETGVLAAPGDVDALGAAIVAAADLDRRACRRRAELCFSAVAMTDRYETWFTELLAAGADTVLSPHAVWHHPPSHPYIDALWPDHAGDRCAEDTWDVATVTGAGTRIVHLHFGFEHLSGDELEAWIGELRRHGIRLVHTVHDIDNPHLVDQAAFHDGLRRVVAAADGLATLTPTARAAIAARYGRAATVIAHPHVVPLADLGAMTGRTHPRRGIYVHASTGRPNLDVSLLAAVATVEDRPPIRVHARASAPPALLRRLDDLHDRRDVAIEIGARLTDRQLWQRLADAELVLLPYRWGTHSGLLEAAHDVGTPVIAPSLGGYVDQGAHALVAEDLGGSVRRALERFPSVTLAGRIAQCADARRAYDRLYADALAAPG